VEVRLAVDRRRGGGGEKGGGDRAVGWYLRALRALAEPRSFWNLVLSGKLERARAELERKPFMLELLEHKNMYVRAGSGSGSSSELEPARLVCITR
jgi:hypothetical protein